VRLHSVVTGFLPNSDVVVRAAVEPLRDSAPLAWAMAPKLCAGDPAAPDACVWYHRVWQYLRLFEIITSIRTNSDFLITTLDCFASDHSRVLVCGSADYGMLAHVKQAYRDRLLDVTVLDRCPTSLYLNQWYADRYAFPIQTACASAVEYESDKCFDVICTHNFIGQFDGASRRHVVAKWHALLNRGGVVITTQRDRPESETNKYGYTPERARALSTRVVESVSARPGLFDGDLHELGTVVYEYAMRQGGYAIRSTSEVTALFENEGFAVKVVDEGAGISERERDRPCSTAGTDTYRMRIVATKR
jgi:hypothetical protein